MSSVADLRPDPAGGTLKKLENSGIVIGCFVSIADLSQICPEVLLDFWVGRMVVSDSRVWLEVF